MKKVSVIVPVYNTEKYLSDCVNSLISQTYENLEIILVDDGSTDGSADICDAYAKKDLRIKVIHKENGGLSSSRETGISSATGDYVTIVDADDWLSLDTVENCISETEKHEDADVVMFSYKREYDSASFETHIFDGDRVFVDEECEDLVYRRLFGLLGTELASPEKADSVVSCCMKLYRREVALKGKYFDTKEVGSGEDCLFNMYALYGVKKIVYIDKCFYHYRKQGGTLSSTFRPNLISQWNRLFDIMEGIIVEKGLSQRYEKALKSRIALSIVGIGMNEFSANGKGFCKKKKTVKEYVKSQKYRGAVLEVESKYMPIKWRLFIFFAKTKQAFLLSIMLKLMLKLKSRKQK